MQQKIPIRCLHQEFSGLARVLYIDVEIAEPFVPVKSPDPTNRCKYTAIWDTGASNTVVTNKVMTECGLKPTGMVNVQTANGEALKPTCLASLWLPNKVCFPQVRVTEGTLSGTDVLIGMDIIGAGDLAITNKDSKTNLSFRVPSIEVINFVKNKPTIMQSDGTEGLRKVGRNEPCPCGSGKKYKKCCAP